MTADLDAPEVPDVPDLPDFTPEQYARSKARKRATAPVRYTSLATDLVAVFVLGFSPAGSALVHAAGKLAGGGWIATALLGAVALRVVLWLLDVPFSLWRERINKAWGLSTRTRKLFWFDSLRGFLIGGILFAAVSLGFFAITRAVPGNWPLVAGACGVALVFVLSFLLPVVIEPLFNKFRPLEDGELRTRLMELADGSGVKVQDVLVSDASKRTTANNAYVSGFGRTRRIVLWDTTIKNCETAEIASVAAHELGHAKRQDVVFGTAVGAVGTIVSVAVLAWALSLHVLHSAAHVTGPQDPRAIALFLAIATVLGALGGPLFNAYSRRIERRADQFGMDLTRDPAAVVATWRRLAVGNLADLDPHPLTVLLFATHPPIPARLAHARQWAAEHRA
ncbi:M48 family metallopeptidase [Actinospica sp.]|uniref:M48 family metallopeptidase n=1 Tax=Actinospica sp. TaxID=1872142 RepID=UPI002BACFBD5|nr:M48 family metallopeptidase [Actinospica sp.]HWG27388.1 M48 family metallopeptidase [Actinospica sp.]